MPGLSVCKKPPFQPHHRHRFDDFALAPSAPPSSISAPNRALPAFHAALRNMELPACMPQPIRQKPVAADHHNRPCGTSTLDYSSSGSPHDPSTACLAAMVHEFLEEEVAQAGSCGRSRCNCVDGVCGNEDGCVADEPKEPEMPDHQLCEILEGISNCSSKPELLLLVDVARAVEMETEELLGTDGLTDRINMDLLRRPVMKRLRQEGYNAAICKSRWKHAEGLPAGDYEYIDVVMEVGGNAGGVKKVERYIVDIDFRSQFDIARASQRYTRLLEVLPRLFVGRAERLKQILKLMSAAAKQSLKEEGLMLPPWRKHRYMQAKWLSSYRRTANGTAAPASGMGRHDKFQLGLGFRAPKMQSVEFTKGMDLLSFREVEAMAEAYATRLSAAHEQQDLRMKIMVDALIVNEEGDGENTRRAVGRDDRRDVCTAMCTDWQLPALDVKPAKGTENHARVSGLSTALKPKAGVVRSRLCQLG